jgi:hypothetical protein
MKGWNWVSETDLSRGKETKNMQISASNEFKDFAADTKIQILFSPLSRLLSTLMLFCQACKIPKKNDNILSLSNMVLTIMPENNF